MKKNISSLFIGLVLISQSGMAKVSDFNNLINENIKAQNEFHEDVKDSMKVVKQNPREKEIKAQKVTVMESEASQYSVPSRKFRFSKEMHQYRPSTQKQIDRLANELKDADKGF